MGNTRLIKNKEGNTNGRKKKSNLPVDKMKRVSMLISRSQKPAFGTMMITFNKDALANAKPSNVRKLMNIMVLSAVDGTQSFSRGSISEGQSKFSAKGQESALFGFSFTNNSNPVKEIQMLRIFNKALNRKNVEYKYIHNTPENIKTRQQQETNLITKVLGFYLRLVKI